MPSRYPQMQINTSTRCGFAGTSTGPLSDSYVIVARSDFSSSLSEDVLSFEPPHAAKTNIASKAMNNKDIFFHLISFSSN